MSSWLVELEPTHSVTVLEDFSRLKASWYLRLSTSFCIWGRSISSMVAARCGGLFYLRTAGRGAVKVTQHIALKCNPAHFYRTATPEHRMRVRVVYVQQGGKGEHVCSSLPNKKDSLYSLAQHRRNRPLSAICISNVHVNSSYSPKTVSR